MRALWFHEYGEPVEVLKLDRIAVPGPPPGRIRAIVQACGLNPADWAVCLGLFAGRLPRGIGRERSARAGTPGASSCCCPAALAGSPVIRTENMSGNGAGRGLCPFLFDPHHNRKRLRLSCGDRSDFLSNSIPSR